MNKIIPSLIAAGLFSLASLSQAATITINFDPGTNNGWNDPTVVAPVGGNTGTTRGQQRRIAFQAAADIVAARIQSSVNIEVIATFDNSTCTPTSANLGSAGSTIVVRDFTNTPVAGTFYHNALANALAGSDLHTTSPNFPNGEEITANFNNNIDDNNACLNGVNWYYGLDNTPPGSDLDFFNTAAHEIAHGLGFSSFTDPSTGFCAGSTGGVGGFPSIYDVFIRDITENQTWSQMGCSVAGSAIRAASAISTGDVVWNGNNANGAITTFGLDAGSVTNDGGTNKIRLYAPNPVEPGSSISHWDITLNPDALMEPRANNSSVGDGLGLMTCQFADVGWVLTGGFSCPDITTAPDINAAPTSVNHGSINTGSTDMQNVVISNTGGGSLNISNVTINGTNASDFSQNGGCNNAMLTNGQTCTIVVTFTSAAPAGARTANLAITSNDADENPLNVGLSATVVLAPAPDIDVNPTSVDFMDVQVGTNSMQNVTVTNNGNATLNITNVAISGTHSADYSQDGGCDSAMLTGGGGQCTIQVTLNPSATGTRTGSLDITSNDPDEGVVNVSLTGNGTAVPQPDINANPTSVDHGTVVIGNNDMQTVTISNTGNATLNISNIAISGTHAAQFGATGCSTPIALNNGQSCNIQVTFTPQTPAGAKTASLDITSDDPDENPLNIPLMGTAQSGTPPDIDVNPTSVMFNSTQIGSNSMMNVVVTNQGPDNLIIGTPSISGTDATQFSQNAGCDGQNLAQNSSCTIVVTFAPLSPPGNKTATLAIPSNDPDEATVNVSLSGQAVTAPEPDIAVNPTSLDFMTVTQGSNSMLTVTVSNTGNADLTISNVAVSGTHSVDYSQDGNCDSAVITSGNDCVITVTFAPSANGTRTASLDISSNDPDENPVNVPLAGTGAPTPTPDIDVNPTSVNFGTVSVGSTGGPRNVTITNTGNAQLNVSSITIGGTHAAQFSKSNTCDSATLSMSQNCVFTVSFTPSGIGGARSANVSIASNDPDENPVTVTLSGTAMNDNDTDGINDAEEAGAPNGGDGNNDGTPDNTQGNVSSFQGNSGDYITVVTSAGSLSSVSASGNPSSGTSPAGVSFPQGFVSYNVTGLANGASTTVTLIFHSGFTPNTVYKYGDEPTVAGNHFYDFTANAVFNGNQVTLSLTDGARGDDDVTANGTIVDPVGAGTASSSGGGGSGVDDVLFSGGGGGGCTINRNAAFSPVFPLMILISLGYILTRRRKTHFFKLG